MMEEVPPPTHGTQLTRCASLAHEQVRRWARARSFSTQRKTTDQDDPKEGPKSACSSSSPSQDFSCAENRWETLAVDCQRRRMAWIAQT
jgi:hypothetical protein